MTSNSYIHDSLASIAQSSALISSLQFHRTEVFTLAVLSPEAWFETHLIRDAEPHELALFIPTDNRYDPIDAQEEDRWTATKRKGPERLGPLEKASPLKEGNRKGNEDPERCLQAAQRLLEIYPMPRAREHVDTLMSQFEGLKASIAELEDQIKRPLPKPVVNTAQEDHNQKAIELAEAIKREEMEIFALEQIMAEKELEKPVVVKSRFVRPPPITASGSNPFAKSNALDRKQPLPVRSTPASPAATSPRRVSSSSNSTSTPAPTTPRAIRTKQSPVATPEKVRTPMKSKPVGAVAEELTPRAVRIAARSGNNLDGGSKRSNGVSDADLELVAAKVWTGVGDILKPWARKTLVQEAEEVPSPLISLPFKSTLKILSTILSSAPETTLASSPGGSIASTLHTTTTTNTTTTEEEDSDPSPPERTTLLEIELLNLLLSTLSSTSPIPSSFPRSTTKFESLPTLSITMRDAILVSSLISTSSSAASPPPAAALHTRSPGGIKKQDAMVSMNSIKVWLGTYAQERGWEDTGTGAVGSTPMGTNAIYALVGKAVLRIDRRGKEGPMLGFRN